MRISVPEENWVDILSDVDLAEVVLWRPGQPQPAGHLDLLLWPYVVDYDALRDLDVSRIGVVQGQSLGFDGVAELLPAGGRFANAVGVHEVSTAELAVALVLASQRNLDGFIRAQSRHSWTPQWTKSLADSTVLIVGAGGIGNAVADRLRPFDATIIRAATRARTDECGDVLSLEENTDVLATVDIVILAVPLNRHTSHLVDAKFLAALADDTLVVNVSRGKVVDIAAVVAEGGRIRFATDVTHPEPLPRDHALWSTPGVLITPHVGGLSAAMQPRVERLVREQLARIAQGDQPAHVVVRT